MLAFAALLVIGDKSTARAGEVPTPAPSPSARELADLFLSDAATRLKPSTLKRYREDTSALCKALGGHTASTVTPSHLTKWIAGLTVTPTTKAIILRSASACFGWAVMCDILAANPVCKVARPKSRSRSEDAVISDADHAKLLGVATCEFRKVVVVLHATGARPGEVCGITAENFDPAAGLAIIRVHKSDKTVRPRLVFTPADVTELLAAERGRWKSGPPLRSKMGVPWTPPAVTRAMSRRLKCGVTGALSYGYRHKFATDALAGGVPDATVAALLGHTSTAMLHKHYSHLTSRADVLRDAANRVRGGRVD